MRLISITLISFFFNVGFGQKILVLDRESKTPISNTTFSSEKNWAVSGENGYVDLELFDDRDSIKISHLSYRSKILTKKNIEAILFLSIKDNILPTVVLSGDLKLPSLEKYYLFALKPRDIGALPISISSLLAYESSLTVQESQSGGGSPNYRGMEANRLLLIVDGIALNNAIYRSGHLQSSSTINPFFIKSIKLISGPASVSYGNGAMGGAVVFKTQEPEFKSKTTINQQFQSNSNAVVFSLQKNYYKNKTCHITSLSIKSVGNLKMGSNRMHNYADWGNEKDIVVNNEQQYTGYSKIDLMHKSKFLINNTSNVSLNTQYSKSSDIFRFDKMNDLKNMTPKYKLWYYGPQTRFFQSINFRNKRKSLLWDNYTVIGAFQQLTESRHIQKTEDTLLNNRNENVVIYDINIDFKKNKRIVNFTYGIGARWQEVISTASLTNNRYSLYNRTRYPKGGSLIKDIFAYNHTKISITKKLNTVFGLRVNARILKANFNDPVFENLKNNNSSSIHSALLTYELTSKTSISGAYYGGFRNPNIDDIGKVFSKDDINVVIPNKELKPEYANNFELTCNVKSKVLDLKIQLFSSYIFNAINRTYGTYNGSDSLLYDGELLRIQMNKNIQHAKIKGLFFSAKIQLSRNVVFSNSFNFLKGVTNQNTPLAHIPPTKTMSSITYNIKNHCFKINTIFAGWKNIDDYDVAGVDNISEATIDGNPSWYTINLDYFTKNNRQNKFMISVHNILDAHYKTFASGISSGGRNFILTWETSF